MITLGPFLIQPDPTPLYWGNITLGGAANQTVWSIHLAPFNAADETPPTLDKFTLYPPSPFLKIHAFDPESARYFSLITTEEHELLRFRPTHLPHNFTALPAEQYITSGWTPVRPLRPAPLEVTQNGYEAVYRTLQEVATSSTEAPPLTLEDIVRKQYQATQTPSTWQIEQEEIAQTATLAETIKNPLTQNGFLLAWHNLKATSTDPLMYCYALIAVIHVDKKSALAHLDTDTAESANTLRRYLIDSTLYKEDIQPLTEDFFMIIQNLLITELKTYQTQQQSDALLALTNQKKLDYEAACEEHARAQLFTPELINTIATEIFLLITKQDTLSKSLDKLRELTHTLQMLSDQDTAYTEIYDILEEQFEAQYPSRSLSPSLMLLLAQTRIAYAEALTKTADACIESNSTDEAIIQSLLPLLKTTQDVNFMLSKLKTTERKHYLLDALHLEDPACPYLQNTHDLNLIAIPLTAKSAQYLFKKRTPAAWGELLLSFNELRQFCWALSMPTKSQFFKAHTARIANITDSDDKIISLFPHINLYQLQLLLSHIPSSVLRHWIQTPKQFKAFFGLQALTYHPKQKVLTLLGAIPAPYRITALVQRKTREAQANLLLRATTSMLILYWKTLSLEEWHELFKQPNHLRELVQTLFKESVFGRIRANELVEHLPEAFKESLYQQLIIEASADAHVSLVESTSLPDIDTLKQAIFSLFPSSVTTHRFFKAAPTEQNLINSDSSFSLAKTIPELKHALIEIYCLMEVSSLPVLNACLLIEAHRLQAHDALELSSDPDCHDEHHAKKVRYH